ncbi:MAG: phosphonopyruvate decarboxylase [Gammaproteobacteria bacterium]|nr:phosphonopyruvate decarboxylase [Gammaproteobacteria bacterium]
MIKAELFVNVVKKLGFGLWTGVPCSYLKPFINYVIDEPDQRYVAAANEGDAVAIAAGAELGGVRAIAMFQNSGLGNAVNPLTSLTHTFNIPILLIATLRGEPGGTPDEPQHELMGEITQGMLDLMGIPWAYFPTEESEVEEAVERAVSHMDSYHAPYAFVMRKGSVEPHKLRTLPQPHALLCREDAEQAGASESTRNDYLKIIQSTVSDRDIIVATTGYMGRELYACEDRSNQFYMVGSMGCASSFGLGLALSQPDRRVYVLDGDGAVLMRMGALATIGYERPGNLVHILLDNHCHESTGGQSTVSHSLDFCAIAASCGYPETHRVVNSKSLLSLLQAAPPSGLRFVHAQMRRGVPDDLPRPSVTPVQVARRLRNFLGETI